MTKEANEPGIASCHIGLPVVFSNCRNHCSSALTAVAFMLCTNAKYPRAGSARDLASLHARRPAASRKRVA